MMPRLVGTTPCGCGGYGQEETKPKSATEWFQSQGPNTKFALGAAGVVLAIVVVNAMLR